MKAFDVYCKPLSTIQSSSKLHGILLCVLFLFIASKPCNASNSPIDPVRANVQDDIAWIHHDGSWIEVGIDPCNTPACPAKDERDMLTGLIDAPLHHDKSSSEAEDPEIASPVEETDPSNDINPVEESIIPILTPSLSTIPEMIPEEVTPEIEQALPTGENEGKPEDTDSMQPSLVPLQEQDLQPSPTRRMLPEETNPEVEGKETLQADNNDKESESKKGTLSPPAKSNAHMPSSPKKPASTSSEFPMWSKNTPDGGARKFTKAPAPGIHPRVLLTPEDLETLRQNALKILPGDDDLVRPKRNLQGLVTAQSYTYLKAGLVQGFPYGDTDALFTGKYGDVYAKLAKGDLSVNLDNVKLMSSNVAEGGLGREGLYGKLSGAAFITLIKPEDKYYIENEIATAVSTTCAIHLKSYKQPSIDFFYHDASADVGLAYDFSATWMTKSQRQPCIDLISAMLTGRQEYGMASDFTSRPQKHNLNWVGWHEHIVILAASIIGDVSPSKTFDPTQYIRDATKVQSLWYPNTVTEAGLAREGGGYFGLSLNWALPAGIAVARASNPDYFQTLPEIYRSSLYFFMLKTPWQSWDSQWHGDSAYAFRPRAQCLLAHIFPEDPLAQYVVQNSWKDPLAVIEPLMCGIFASRGAGGDDNMGNVAEVKSIPRVFFDRDRGEGLVRSGWKKDDLMVDFENRLDSFRLGHIHADRLSFYVYARGRKWFVDNPKGDVENAAHQTVRIDGLGMGGGSDAQGRNMWPGFPGKWENFDDNGEVTVMAGSAKESYGLALRCLEKDQYECRTNKYTADMFNYVKDPLVLDWMSDAEDGKVGDDENAVFNPVEKAFRTVAVTHGGVKRPFVIIVDDFKKDDKERRYEWLGNVPFKGMQWRHEDDDVIEDTAMKSGDFDVILKYSEDGNEAASPRLLVRVLQHSGSLLVKPHVEDIKIRTRDAQSSKLGGKERTGRVVRFETRSKIGEFVTLAFPFAVGEDLPVTSVESGADGMLKVVVDGKAFGIEAGQDGRRRISSL